MNQLMKSLYWVWLAEACGPASKAASRLLACYEDPFDLYRLEDEELERLEHISAALRIKLADKSLDRIYGILRICEQEGIRVISYADPDYPARLRKIEDPPVVLYCKGTLPDLNARLCIGMVGTRKMSEYGKQTAYTISCELAQAGAVVVSGMAKGIDGVCACGVLEAGGQTVAILGSGVNVVYPKEHTLLMQNILKKGAVLSEYPPNEPPYSYNFPKRNRIISGLSQGIVVIESPQVSGALITAERAIAQGREVFALPGQINAVNSHGTNELIRNGAHVALGAEDVLKFYAFLYRDTLVTESADRRAAERVSCDTALAKYGVGDPAGSIQRGSGGAKPRKKQAERPCAAEEGAAEKKADHSADIVAVLDQNTRRVFESLPMDRAVTPDFLTAEGVDAGSAMTALSILEVYGLVASLPGGMYIRK